VALGERRESAKLPPVWLRFGRFCALIVVTLIAGPTSPRHWAARRPNEAASSIGVQQSPGQSKAAYVNQSWPQRAGSTCSTLLPRLPRLPALHGEEAATLRPICSLQLLGRGGKCYRHLIGCQRVVSGEVPFEQAFGGIFVEFPRRCRSYPKKSLEITPVWGSLFRS